MTHSTNPIKDISFKGLHWIEASAGSGKTYTLSSLMVRVLMEQYLPNQVVATTFTRAATAELQARIRSRLVETYRFFDSRRTFTAEENLAYAASLEATDVLMASLLTSFSSKVSYACERAKLVIEQLDHLFVGTLDSFSQKLLREFAFESGKIERAEITDNSKKYIQQIIHDSLRVWVNGQSQTLLDLMYASGQLSGVDAYTKLVEDSLNFGTAEFKEPPVANIDTSRIPGIYPSIDGFDFSCFKDYYDIDGINFKGVSGTYFKPTSKFNILFTVSIPKFIELVKNQNYQAFFTKDFEEHRAVLKTFANNFHSGKLLTSKCSPEAKNIFLDHHALHALVELVQEFHSLLTALDDAEATLKHYLCVEAKRRLPEMLQQKSETTFAHQISTLADALNGPNGKFFATAVQQKYPLIIVDEFQDTNQEQDNILASIWRDKERYNSGCMIMVGDRKQAIYGFRGGDMLTFINAYSDVRNKRGQFYHLTYNHRSIPELVQAVDALFQLKSDFGEQVVYQPVFAGSRPHEPLVENEIINPFPMRWVHLEKGVDAHQQIAKQVVKILNQGQRGELCFAEDGINRSVTESDIAILAKANEDLDKIQYELEKNGVSVNRPSRRSVFEGVIAHDVAAVLSAIMNPNDEEKVRRALLSLLIGLDLGQLSEIENQADGLGFYISEFHAIRELWFERGFLSAWQYLVDTFNVWENAITSNGKDSERTVVNLRHLSELLSQYSSQYQGPQSLYQWYLRQITKPGEREWELERSLSNDSGVKLMTIHKSKGLEFKIVLLFKADGALRENNKTLNYSTARALDPRTQQEIEKRVIGVGAKEHFNDEELDQHKQRLEAENRRQWYVALTRASHRMYIFMHDEKNTSASGVGYWKNSASFENFASTVEPLVVNYEKYTPAQAQSIEVHAQDIPSKRFYPRQQTNFTALSQHLSNEDAQDFLVQNYSGLLVDDETNAVFIEQSSAKEPLYFINKNFAMGMLAGTFLHDVLDIIDFQNEESWPLDIYRRLKNGHFSIFSQMKEKYTQIFGESLSSDEINEKLVGDLVQWFKQITSAKLHKDLCLNNLSKKSYLSEMPFCISLSEKIFLSHKISELLEKHGVVMPELNRSETAKYLNGSIDLVYQYQGKFYVADYKSNYLGTSFSDYNLENMEKSMMQSSYFLQASIYLVALHRYLKKRLSNYDPQQHLGGATYLYLRGMDSEKATGVFNWNPDIELILELNELLGSQVEV